MSVSVAVAGASGYAGGEVLRLLAAHPGAKVKAVTAHTQAGARLGDVHPHLTSLAGLTLAPTTPQELAGHDVIILALPHGESGALAAALPSTCLVLDCGADHRLTDPAAWDAYYGGDFHEPWTYGLPELLTGWAAGSAAVTGAAARPAAAAEPPKQRAAITPGTSRIAVPGCNVTAVSLALAPALAAGLAEPGDIVAVLANGVSGAGKALKPHLLASEILGSASPYAVGGSHRHIPEIQQNLALALGASGDGQVPTLSFTPTLVPMARGILATCTARLRPGVSQDALRAAYERAYGTERFVALLPEGRWPATAATLGANTAHLQIAADERAGRLIAICALDNLVKGTAGAAIQSMNLALGLPEHLGLTADGVAP